MLSQHPATAGAAEARARRPAAPTVRLEREEEHRVPPARLDSGAPCRAFGVRRRRLFRRVQPAAIGEGRLAALLHVCSLGQASARVGGDAWRGSDGSGPQARACAAAHNARHPPGSPRAAALYQQLDGAMCCSCLAPPLLLPWLPTGSAAPASRPQAASLGAAGSLLWTLVRLRPGLAQPLGSSPVRYMSSVAVRRPPNCPDAFIWAMRSGELLMS